MKWVIIVLVVIVAVVAIVYLIGYFMPVKHKAMYSVRVNAQPAEVWKAITDYHGYSTWRKGLKNVVVTDEKHWTETSGDGTIHFEGEMVKPNEVFISRITNKNLPFGGAWYYELVPEGNETKLIITEEGEVYNPVFRVMSKYVFGHETTLRKYGADLTEKFRTK
jgi:hypothetical protein